MANRSKAQRYWDRFLLVSLFGAVSTKHSTVGGNLKAQKLVFLLELAAQRQQRALAHYRFFRYQMGPYSSFLAEDIKRLVRNEFLYTHKGPTKRGIFLRDYVIESLGDNQQLGLANAAVQRIAADYGRKTGAALMDIVYGLKVPVSDYEGSEERVRDIPLFVDILDPVRDSGLREIQPLTDELVEDLEAEFAIDSERLREDHSSYKSAVRRAIERVSA